MAAGLAEEIAIWRRSGREWRAFAAWHFRRIQPAATPTMLRLTSRRRSVLADALRELANLTAGALVLGRFVGNERWSVWLLLTGIGVWLVLVGLAVAVANGNSNG